MTHTEPRSFAVAQTESYRSHVREQSRELLAYAFVSGVTLLLAAVGVAMSIAQIA